MAHPAPRKILHITMAALLVLWMTGAGCLLGCERGLAVAQNLESLNSSSLATVVTGDVCASHAGDCCARDAAHRKAAVVEDDVMGSKRDGQEKLFSADADASGPMGNCPLSVNALAVVSKVRHEKTVAAPAAVIQLSTSSLQNNRFPSVQPSAPPGNRGHTYLRCCVFLI